MSARPSQPPKTATPAVYWFNRKRSSDMTPEDARAFEAWLALDAENAAAFEKVQRTWAFLGKLDGDPAIEDARDHGERDMARVTRQRRAGAIAAGLAALAVGVWGLTRTDWFSGVPWLAPAPTQEFRTSVGQRTTVTLLDHSVVMLDTDTVLRARITGFERRVELERGQAFFQVAKDRHRPFIVMAAGKSVRATGTAFDVRNEPGRFEVTLIEGRVRVEEQTPKTPDAPVADMRPGWRLAVREDARWRMEAVDVVKSTGWHDGMLSFFNEPVESATAEMNRYSQRKIVFRGAAPTKSVLGNFRAGDVDTFVEALEINKLARVVSRQEDRIEVSAR